MRQIGELGFGGNELRKCARTLHVGGSFFVGNWAGIEVLAKPIFVRGIAPSMAGAPCALFIQNHCAKMGKLVFGGNELRKCVRTFHGRFVYCGNGEGIEVLAKPIFVRGIAPSMEAALPPPSMEAAQPPPSMAGMPRARTSRPFCTGTAVRFLYGYKSASPCVAGRRFGGFAYLICRVRNF